MLRPAIFCAAALAIAGCSGSSNNGPTDAGAPDAGLDGGSGDAGYDPSCSAPGTPGNSPQGVGKFCTPGGGECFSNPTQYAFFCTADHADTNEWFCTMSCHCDADCGTGAICTSDNPDGGGIKGCVPLPCAGDQPVSTPVCLLPDGGAADGG